MKPFGGKILVGNPIMRANPHIKLELAELEKRKLNRRSRRALERLTRPRQSA